MEVSKEGVWATLGRLKRDPLQFFVDEGRRGDVSARRLFFRDVLIVSRPELVKHVLQDNHTAYQKGAPYHRMRPLVGNGLLTSDGAEWIRQRRLAQPAFHRQRIAAFAAAMVSRADGLIARLRAHPQRAEGVSMREELMRTTLAIVGDALFSIDLLGEAARFGEALELALEEIDDRIEAIAPLPMWVPAPTNRRLLRARRVLDATVERLIAERRARAGEDLLGMLLEARDDDGGGMTDRQLRDEVMTMLLAGHETSATALSWWFYLLGRHPDEAARVRAEVDAVVGARPPALEDLPQLPALARSIDETLRLFPPAWIISRQAITRDSLDGVEVKPGAVVMLSPYVVHHDPRWWPRPDAFEPSRFEAVDRPKLAFFPFAAGPRQCIGNHFALMELQLVGARLLQAFEWTLASEQPIAPVPKVVLRPGQQVRARLVPRA